MLIAITIFTLAGGAVLGLRYKVFILVPAVLFAILAVIGASVARGAGIWTIVLEVLVGATALQLGYVGGSAFTLVRSVRKPSRVRPTPAHLVDPGNVRIGGESRSFGPVTVSMRNSTR
jgi:hypothetical protein